MKIHGFQKLTVLDYPGKVACTVFTAGCNLRCPFCHNSPLVTRVDPREEIAQEDVFAYLEKRRGILDGVAVTGGEPLLQPDIDAFLRRVKSLGLLVKLDTNGAFPERLEALVTAGLVDCVAMDVKNSPARYARTAGVPDLDIAPIAQSVKLLLSGRVDCEFRTTAVREEHTLEDFEAIGRFIKGAKRYYIQNFVDSGDLIGEGLHPCSREFLTLAAERVKPFVENVEIRGV